MSAPPGEERTGIVLVASALCPYMRARLRVCVCVCVCAEPVELERPPVPPGRQKMEGQGGQGGN